MDLLDFGLPYEGVLAEIRRTEAEVVLSHARQVNAEYARILPKSQKTAKAGGSGDQSPPRSGGRGRFVTQGIPNWLRKQIDEQEDKEVGNE